MASVHDVAAYILQKYGTVSAMKLQKLVYYSQAWSLVWEERPIFDEQIQAWANGPVIPELYVKHRGQFQVEKWPWGDPEGLCKDDKETVDAVLKFYGDKTAQWLSDLTHREDPWQDARVGVAPGDWCANEISCASMHEYYSSLQQ
jgi:uncharacterized phage-associated protein